MATDLREKINKQDSETLCESFHASILLMKYRHENCFIVELQFFFFFFRNLSDLDKDGQLNIEEFAIAMHFVEVAKVGQALPPTVPQELLPLAYQSRQVSANNMPLVQEGRERSDSGLDRSGSERERSGSIDGKSRSGSITVCKSSIVSQEL